MTYYPAQPLYDCDASKYWQSSDGSYEAETLCSLMGNPTNTMPAAEAPGFEPFERMTLRENVCPAGIDTTGMDNRPGLYELGDIQDPRADTPFAASGRLVVSLANVFLLTVYLIP